MAERGVNKVILIGRLGNEPELRYTQSGAAIANLSIATSESWQDKQSGDRQERTEWHRVVFFSRLAEIVGEYLHKGAQVYVEGRLQTRKWQDRDGHDRYTTEVVANEMRMLGAKGDRLASVPDSPPAPDPSKQGMPVPEAPKVSPGSGVSKPADDFDDDIPF